MVTLRPRGLVIANKIANANDVAKAKNRTDDGFMLLVKTV